jgi:hypothetical protein
MESTSVYWIPIFELLDARGFAVFLVNATAAAFGWTVGILWSILGFDLFRFISNPPANGSGRAGQRYWIRFLNGVAGWRHHSQARNNPWTMFFNGVTCHQNHNGRSLPGAG